MKTLLSALLLALLALIPDSARADIRAPGVKWIAYGFAIENAADFPDYVFLAFPWSGSNGAPTTEIAEVTSSGTDMGRRSGLPTIYAAKRNEYLKWKVTNDKDLAKFFTGNVAATSLKLKPLMNVDEGNPIEGVQDVIRVVKCCEGKSFEAKFQKVVYRVKGGKTKEIAYATDARPEFVPDPPAPSPAASSSASSSSSPSPSSSSKAGPAAAPSGGSATGCGGCATSSSEKPLGVALLIIAGVLGVWVARRRSLSISDRAQIDSRARTKLRNFRTPSTQV